MEKLEKIVNENFVGRIKQTPPSFSAININGKKSYDLARAGKEVILKPVERVVYSFEIKQISEKKIWFRVEVSSGTYIRAFARDIGKKNNIPMTLTKLNRVKIDTIDLKSANQLSDKKLIEHSRVQMFFIKELEITKIEMKKVLEGKLFINYDFNNTMELIVKNEGDEVLLKKVGKNKFFIKKRLA